MKRKKDDTNDCDQQDQEVSISFQSKLVMWYGPNHLSIIIFRQEIENRCPNPKKMKANPLLKKFDENSNSGAHPSPITPLRISIVKLSLVSLAEAPDLVFMLNGKSHLHFRCVYDLVPIGAHLVDNYVHNILQEGRKTMSRSQ